MPSGNLSQTRISPRAGDLCTTVVPSGARTSGPPRCLTSGARPEGPCRYQTFALAASGIAIGEPSGMPNAVAKAGVLASGPLTR